MLVQLAAEQKEAWEKAAQFAQASGLAPPTPFTLTDRRPEQCDAANKHTLAAFSTYCVYTPWSEAEMNVFGLCSVYSHVCKCAVKLLIVVFLKIPSSIIFSSFSVSCQNCDLHVSNTAGDRFTEMFDTCRLTTCRYHVHCFDFKSNVVISSLI